MADSERHWQRLLDLARQAPPSAEPALPPGFVDGVLARWQQPVELPAARPSQRPILIGALAASLLAAVVGLWSWDGVAAEWAQSPPGLDLILPLESLP